MEPAERKNGSGEYQREAARAMQAQHEKAIAKAGRPSLFNDDIAAHICGGIASGSSLNRLCSEPGMPTVFTVYNWLRNNPTFFQQYQQARLDQADTLADEIMSISDDTAHATDPLQIQAARLRVDSRRWIASRLKPSKWGEKASEIAINVGDNVPSISVSFVTPEPRNVLGEVIEQD
jgi:hypothetical protein